MGKAKGTTGQPAQKRKPRRGTTLKAAREKAKELRRQLKAWRARAQEAEAEAAELKSPDGVLSSDAFQAAMQANEEDLAALDEIIQGAVVVQTDEGPMLKPIRNARARVAALELKFAYGYGRPPQPVAVEGGARPVRVVIEEVDPPEE